MRPNLTGLDTHRVTRRGLIVPKAYSAPTAQPRATAPDAPSDVRSFVEPMAASGAKLHLENLSKMLGRLERTLAKSEVPATRAARARIESNIRAIVKQRPQLCACVKGLGDGSDTLATQERLGAAIDSLPVELKRVEIGDDVIKSLDDALFPLFSLDRALDARNAAWTARLAGRAAENNRADIAAALGLDVDADRTPPRSSRSADEMIAIGRSLVPTAVRETCKRYRDAVREGEPEAIRDRLYDQAVAEMTEFRNTLKRNSTIGSETALALARSAPFDETVSREFRLDLQFELKSFHEITNGLACRTLKRIATDADRGYANAGTGMADFGRDADGFTVWHELAHHVESSNPEIYRAARELVARRADGIPVPIEIETTLSGTRSGVAYHGNFPRRYAGRVYRNATEIVSTGLEDFATPFDMVDSLVADEELFSFIVGATR